MQEKTKHLYIHITDIMHTFWVKVILFYIYIFIVNR